MTGKRLYVASHSDGFIWAWENQAIQFDNVTKASQNRLCQLSFNPEYIVRLVHMQGGHVIFCIERREPKPKDCTSGLCNTKEAHHVR